MYRAVAKDGDLEDKSIKVADNSYWSFMVLNKSQHAGKIGEIFHMNSPPTFLWKSPLPPKAEI